MENHQHNDSPSPLDATVTSQNDIDIKIAAPTETAKIEIPTESTSPNYNEKVGKKTLSIYNDLKIENNGDVKGQYASINMHLFTGSNEHKLAFDYFEKKGTRKYKLQPLPPSTTRQFRDENFLMVTSDNDTVLADALGVILSDTFLSHYEETICCTIEEQRSFRLREVVSQFQESERAKKGETQVLIVFDTRQDSELINQFLGIIYNANTLSAFNGMLRSEKLYLIYCSNGHSLSTASPEIQIPIYNLRFWDVVLFQRLSIEVVSALGTKIYSLIRTTGWLTNFTEAERIATVNKLIDSGTLETELSTQEKKIDYDYEAKVLPTLLSDPLKNTILLIAAFFENVSVIDFQNIVGIALGNDVASGGTINIQPHDSLLQKWQFNPAVLLHECELVTDRDQKPSRIKFKSQKRQEVCADTVVNEYRIQLNKIAERLRAHYLVNRSILPQTFLDGIVKICFKNVQNYSGNYIAEVCNSIIQVITDASLVEKKSVMRNLFFRLLYVIKEWEKIDGSGSDIDEFYDDMNSSDIRRVILSAMFNDLCSPEYPHNIHRLKKLLESIGKEEVEPMIDSIHQIFLNHAENIFNVLEIIQSWRKENKNVNIAFSYAACSFLKIFYKDWEEGEKIVSSNTNAMFRLLRHLTTKDGPANIKRLGNFIFDRKNLEAFVFTYRALTNSNVNEKLIQKEALDSLLLRFGLILIQVNIVYSNLISNEGESPGLINQELSTELFTILIMNFELQAAKSSITKAIGFYNEVILQLDSSSPNGRESKKTLIRKRDIGRELQKLVNRIIVAP